MIPLKDRVVMRQLNAKETTKSGIILTPQSQKKPNLAVVLFKGDEVKDTKVGDMVVLGTKWFTNFDLEGQELLILNEPDLMGILEPEERAKVEAEYGK